MMVQRSFMIPTEDGQIRIKRIDKREARKRFYEGKDIYLKHCKIDLVSKWLVNNVINKTLGESFDNLVNIFEYYNCNNETGTYASFYVADS